MAKTIDARGLSCPQPVLMAVRAVEAYDFPITVTVDNDAAKANIIRTLKARKLKLETASSGKEFVITIRK